ncbi:MAG TPA: YhjD/YihY/BrkB family envelope integrity protein [Acidimicrobiia bacterium]|nr:YhjD/YihY/BrkB family envelope integrity protein [Acidimicrobiia bacterium]
MAEPATNEGESRYRRARRRVDNARQGITDRATQLDERVPAAHHAFRAYEHDRLVGGEIMAGAIAFRLFVFLLPLVLVLVTTLGFAADASHQGAAKVAKEAGIAGLAAQSVSDSARVSNGGRWIALIIGLFALYSTSIALARAVRIAHGLAWGRPAPRWSRTWRAAVTVVTVALGVALLTSVAGRLNTSHRLAGLILMLCSVVVYGGIWFWISLLLPHGDAPWTALVPGAVLVGFGVQILHFLTIYYVSRRVSHSSQLYGALGGAVAILGWAYLVGRLAVASAVLNATLYRDRVHS